MRRYGYSLAFMVFLGSFCINKAAAQTYARNGMVVSDNVLASEVGTAVLEKGGNAVDASIATAFALAVTHPQAGNIGGGGFLVFMDKQGEVTTIDFREKAPLAAQPDMFLEPDGSFIKGTSSKGLKSVGVPGTVAGLWMAHQKYGSLPWNELVKPAIDLAQNGFELTWTLAKHANGLSQSDEPEFLKNYFRHPDGKLATFGEVWKQPELANTLKLIRDKGKDGFYAGPVATEIEAYMKANGGIITKADLKKYNAVERKPIVGTFKGHTIYSMAPPSSGGVAIIEMLNILEHSNIDSIPFNSTAYYHLVAETMRRAFSDRAQYLGDPDFNPDMPLDQLTSKSHAKERFEAINMQKASVSDSSKFGQLSEGDHTTHLSVIDKNGAAVSLTYTLEMSYGSGMGSEKLGFIFNNEMGDFNPKPGHTASWGIIGTPPNVIAPEKRMLSSMSPAIVAKDGKPVLVIGSPGGRTIINTVFQTILNYIQYDMQVDKAIEASKIHHQWLPDRILIEEHMIAPDVQQALKEMGHTLAVRQKLGRLMGIQIDWQNEVYIGAADSSSPDGGAIGY